MEVFIKTQNDELEIIDKLKIEISKYDSSILIDKEDKFDELIEIINNAKLGQAEYEKKISENNNELKILGIDIDNITNNFTNDLLAINKDLEMEMMQIKEKFVANVNDYLADANQKAAEIAEKQSKIHNEIDTLMNDGKNLKNENHELENSSVCITCKRPLEDVDMGVIREKVLDNKNKMTELMLKVNELKPNDKELTKEINKLKDKIIKIKNKDYSFDPELLNTYNNSKDSIKTIKQKIEKNTNTVELIKNNNIPSKLAGLLTSSTKRKSEISLYIDDLEKELDTIVKDLEKKKEEYDTLKSTISNLKEEKEQVDTKKAQIANETKISMEIGKSETKINDLNKRIKEYNSMIDMIEKNEEIEEEIDVIDDILEELDENIKEKNNEKMNHQSTLRLFENQLEGYKEDAITYKTYKKQDEIMNTYMKCVHRDGLPTFLLKKSIHIINQELSKILTDVDFAIFFDSELNLKMSAENRLDVMQNAIESSGMERTFTAVALKIALRKVNNKSKPNFILLDEIMGKLLEESVEMFVKLLDNIKEDVDKLVIIEHTHPINYDVLIEVEKDIEGISVLTTEY